MHIPPLILKIKVINFYVSLYLKKSDFYGFLSDCLDRSHMPRFAPVLGYHYHYTRLERQLSLAERTECATRAHILSLSLSLRTEHTFRITTGQCPSRNHLINTSKISEKTGFLFFSFK